MLAPAVVVAASLGAHGGFSIAWLTSAPVLLWLIGLVSWSVALYTLYLWRVRQVLRAGARGEGPAPPPSVGGPPNGNSGEEN